MARLIREGSKGGTRSVLFSVLLVVVELAHHFGRSFGSRSFRQQFSAQSGVVNIGKLVIKFERASPQLLQRQCTSQPLRQRIGREIRRRLARLIPGLPFCTGGDCRGTFTSTPPGSTTATSGSFPAQAVLWFCNGENVLDGFQPQ
jgi:hypothetical protein